jgi:GDP-L-fucose synthase
LEGKRIWVAGHRGLAGSAVARALGRRDVGELLTVGREELDLREQSQVRAWMQKKRPQAVIVASAKVGGIYVNDTYPADFIYDNLIIEANIIEAAYRFGVEKLLFLGSSCIYPKHAAQPMFEEALLTGPLEPTNEWYAIAKIAGIKLCQAYRKQHGCDYISAMPCGLYGPNDNFDLQSGHVLPSLLRRFHEAKESGAESIALWGTGKARREFMHVDDFAESLLFLMENYSEASHINIGPGYDLEIGELAQIIKDVVGFRGRITYDTTRPDGMMRKLMGTERLDALGWKPTIDLRTGIEQTYRWFLDNRASLRELRLSA